MLKYIIKVSVVLVGVTYFFSNSIQTLWLIFMGGGYTKNQDIIYLLRGFPFLFLFFLLFLVFHELLFPFLILLSVKATHAHTHSIIYTIKTQWIPLVYTHKILYWNLNIDVFFSIKSLLKKLHQCQCCKECNVNQGKNTWQQPLVGYLPLHNLLTSKPLWFQLADNTSSRKQTLNSSGKVKWFHKTAQSRSYQHKFELIYQNLQKDALFKILNLTHFVNKSYHMQNRKREVWIPVRKQSTAWFSSRKTPGAFPANAMFCFNIHFILHHLLWVTQFCCTPLQRKKRDLTPGQGQHLC